MCSSLIHGYKDRFKHQWKSRTFRYCLIVFGLFFAIFLIYLFSEWDYDYSKYKVDSSTTAGTQRLREYYIKFQTPENAHYDENDVYLSNFGPLTGKHHYTIKIAQVGLASYEKYLSTHKQEYKERFLAQADGLVSAQKKSDTRFGIWCEDFDVIGHSDTVTMEFRNGTGTGYLCFTSCLSIYWERDIFRIRTNSNERILYSSKRWWA